MLASRPRNSSLRYLFSLDGGTSGSRSKDVAIKIVRAYERDRWRISPRRLGSKVDSIPIDRPIFILGTRGGGGTLVGRCLRRNRDVVTVSGNSENWTGADEMATIRNRQLRLPPVLWGSKHRSDLDIAPFGTDQPHAADQLLPLYRATAEDASPEVAARLARLIREHIAVYARDRRHARFLDKTHAFTLKIPLLATVLEASRPFFVLVIRNPYVVCPWMVERKPTLFRAGTPDEERLRLVAENWANSYATALLDARTIPNVFALRFEDFLASPERSVRALCESLGLDFDDSLIPRAGQRIPFATLPGDRKWYPLYPSSTPRQLPAEWEQIISLRCGTLAESFGYTPEGASEPSGSVEVLGAGPLPYAPTQSSGTELPELVGLAELLAAGTPSAGFLT